jgi:hypothetical protein
MNRIMISLRLGVRVRRRHESFCFRWCNEFQLQGVNRATLQEQPRIRTPRMNPQALIPEIRMPWLYIYNKFRAEIARQEQIDSVSIPF